jgi:fatty acyl-CoA reductase
MIAEEYLGDFPNTYTLTKNLAENLVQLETKESKLIAAIVRPGIVSPAYRDPNRGWIDSLNGISGAVLMTAVGLARNGRVDLEARVDPIPADIVANTCIAAAWAANFK